MFKTTELCLSKVEDWKYLLGKNSSRRGPGEIRRFILFGLVVGGRNAWPVWEMSLINGLPDFAMLTRARRKEKPRGPPRNLYFSRSPMSTMPVEN